MYLTEIRTLHTYGSPCFFKPSVAEVLAQIPDDMLEGVVAFETRGPSDVADMNRESEALNAGFHVARTRLYGARPVEAPSLPPTRWVPVADVLAVIQDPRWSWVRNSPCKYLELRLDTRDQRCLIYNRDREAITLQDLRRQGDAQLEPTHE